MYIQVPAALQREKGVVCWHDRCYLEQEYRSSFPDDDVSELRQSESFIVLRIQIDPFEDTRAREKVASIHASLVSYLERGGALDRIEEFVRELEDRMG
jgi:hypothetical protein